jgi:hypothetical protein
VGICTGGTETCDAQGASWGACEGEVVPNAETCASTDDEDCDGLECVMWAQALGDGGALADASITAVAASPDGTLVVAGAITGAPAKLGPVSLSVIGPFIAKVKADGTALWAVQPTAGEITALAVDATGNVFAAGATSADALLGATAIVPSQFVVRLGVDGTVTWVKQMAGMKAGANVGFYGRPTSIAVGPAGDVLVAGYFTATALDLGDGPVPTAAGGDATGYVAKLSGVDGAGSNATTGSRWTQTYAEPKVVFGFYGPFVGVSLLDGSATVALNFTGSVSLAGAALTSAGGRDIAVVRLAADGTSSGSRILGDAQDQTVLDATVSQDGTLLLAGAFLGTIVPDDAAPSVQLVAASSAGSVFGELYGDGFGIALGASGLHVRMATSTGTAGHGTALRMDANGNYLFTGTFSGTADLGGGPLDGGTGSALLLAKLTADGKLAWARGLPHAQDGALVPLLAPAPAGQSWLAGVAGAWPFDVGTGPLNTAAHPKLAFLARLAP